MLSMADIERLENYLFSAKLEDVPNVFGRVLPLIFAELRVMAIALDTQAQEFLGHHEIAQARPHDTGAVRDSGRNEGRGNDVVSGREVPPSAAARHPQAVENRIQEQGVAVGAVAKGDGGTQGGSAGPVAGAGVEQQVGGQVGRRRRGRPPKGSQPVDAVLDIHAHPRLSEGGA